MSPTGEPEGEPVKVGIGNADLVTGLYAGVAILAALRHRDRTGEGQHTDDVLGELVGLDDVERAGLRAKDVI